MKLEVDLRDDLMVAAEASHRPASQLVRELMREFVARRRARRDQADFLSHKVDAVRQGPPLRSGRGTGAPEGLRHVRWSRRTPG